MNGGAAMGFLGLGFAQYARTKALSHAHAAALSDALSTILATAAVSATLAATN